MNKKLKYTNIEYVKALKLINDKIEVLEDFKGMKVKILHKCSCNKPWYVAPASLLSGNSKTCGKCLTFSEYLITMFGKDAVQKYWSKENSINPWEISYQMNSPKVKILCQEKDYHGSYDITCANFVNGRRCGYCNSNGGKSHWKDSIAQHIIDTYGEDNLEKIWNNDKNILNPWEVPKGSDKRIYLNCIKVDYHGGYSIRTADFYQGAGFCPCCGSKTVHPLDSLGHNNPKALELWSEKNIKLPYEYKVKSREYVYWKCENNIHKDYKRTIIGAVSANFRCLECVKLREESFLQESVKNYILNNYVYELLHEKQCNLVPVNPKTNRFLPFDNELHINDDILIIEVHGRQHYEAFGWNITNAKSNNITALQSLEYQQWKDNLKKQYALSQNAYYLEISYISIENGSYEALIDKMISSILAEAKEGRI